MNTITQNFKDNLLNTGYKLIYPNSKKIELRIFAKNIFTLVKKAQNTRLTLIQTVSNWNQLFLREDYYKFIKNLKKDEVFIKFFNENGYEKKFIFSTIKIYDEKGMPYNSLFVKKNKEIYLNFDSKSVIIIINDKFKTKKEKAWIKKQKKKGHFTKNLDSLIN